MRKRFWPVAADELREISNRYADKRHANLLIAHHKPGRRDPYRRRGYGCFTATFFKSRKARSKLRFIALRSVMASGTSGRLQRERFLVYKPLVASTHDLMPLFLLLNLGMVYRPHNELPVGSRTTKGSAIINVIVEITGRKSAQGAVTLPHFPERAQSLRCLLLSREWSRRQQCSSTTVFVSDGSHCTQSKGMATSWLTSVVSTQVTSASPLCSSDGKAILFDEAEV